MSKHFIVVSCLLLVVSLVGCSKTVTQVVTYGNQMVVEVTLRGTMDVNHNRYFMVIGDNSAYKVPLPPPDNVSFEVLEPGTTPSTGSIADYYTNFWSTWAGYIFADPSGYTLVSGPFIQGVAPTRILLASPGEITTKIKFHFSLSQIFGGLVPNTIYFDFITVPWPSGQKLPADHLTSTDAYISTLLGSKQTVNDQVDPTLDPSTDILTCEVTIQ